MKIFSWNVNGIRACHKKGFMDWFNKTQPDVLCLQEVRADLEQIPPEILDIPGYTKIWNPAARKGYSGTAIFTTQKPLEIHLGMGIDEFDCEGRMTQIVYDRFVINGIYFPNGSSSEDRLDYKLRYYDAFLENSNQWIRQGKHVITLGDYNTCHQEIDIARPKENEGNSGFLPIERAWMDKYCDGGYVDTFRSKHPTRTNAYTWWSNRGGARARNIGWRIDYCFVDQSLAGLVLAADIHAQVPGSDHCPISVEMDLAFE